MVEPTDPSKDLTEAEAVAALIAELGGVRPAAKVIGSPFTTVQYWKQKGSIPIERRAEIQSRAAAAGVSDSLLALALPETSAAPSVATKLPGEIERPSQRSAAKKNQRDTDQKQMSDIPRSSGSTTGPTTEPTAAPRSIDTPKLSETQQLGAKVRLVTAASLGLSALAILTAGAVGWLITQDERFGGGQATVELERRLDEMSQRVELLDGAVSQAEQLIAETDSALRAQTTQSGARLTDMEFKLDSLEDSPTTRGQALTVDRLQEETSALRDDLSLLQDDLLPDLAAELADLEAKLSRDLATLDQFSRAVMSDNDTKTRQVEEDIKATLHSELHHRDQELAELEATVDRIDRTHIAAAQRLLAALTLYHVSQTATPITPSLELVRLTHAGVADSAPIISELETLAARTPSRSDLLSELPDLVAHATQLALMPQQQSWWSVIAAELLSLFKIRKIEPDRTPLMTSTDDSSASMSDDLLDVLARIRIAAGTPENGLEVSLDLLDSLPSELAHIFVAWRHQAAARLRLEALTLNLVMQSAAQATLLNGVIQE